MVVAAESVTLILPSLEEATRLDAIVDQALAEASGKASEVYNAMLDVRASESWRTLGWKTWADYAESKLGRARRTVFMRLEAAAVVRELESVQRVAQVDDDAMPPGAVPLRQLAALAKAPEGTRAEVLSVATKAADGKPTEAVVKAAVEAKKARPKATPAELVKAVVESKPKASKIKLVIPEAVEDIREEYAEQAAKRDEITDEEWLASLPLEGKLAGHVLDKFRRDALYFRDFEPIRRSLKDFHGKAKGRRFKGSTSDGFVPFRVGQLLAISHPKAWMECRPLDAGGCGGTGTVGMIGPCPMCHGRGYLAR